MVAAASFFTPLQRSERACNTVGLIMKIISDSCCVSPVNNFFKTLSRQDHSGGSVSACGCCRSWPGPALAADAPFYLKSGDRVCFYGDSITEQRYYGVDVETYVRTRFPELHVKFVNSGVGGDRVTGGWAGPIDQRLERDVFPFKPDVVTIMLGMNDASYRAFNPGSFSHLHERLRTYHRIAPETSSRRPPCAHSTHAVR